LALESDFRLYYLRHYHIANTQQKIKLTVSVSYKIMIIDKYINLNNFNYRGNKKIKKPPESVRFRNMIIENS